MHIAYFFANIKDDSRNAPKWLRKTVKSKVVFVNIVLAKINKYCNKCIVHCMLVLFNTLANIN